MRKDFGRISWCFLEGFYLLPGNVNPENKSSVEGGSRTLYLREEENYYLNPPHPL